jgi:hypothetical protein
MKNKQLERVRRICLALPETSEKLSHGEPTFFVRKKVSRCGFLFRPVFRQISSKLRR